MPRILISNIDNESMMADERALTPDFCRSSSITAGRMAWFAEPGDIVVLPRDLSPQLKVYIARTMGYEPGSVTYLTPDWGSGHPRPIRAHELLHTGLAQRHGAPDRRSRQLDALSLLLRAQHRSSSPSVSASTASATCARS